MDQECCPVVHQITLVREVADFDTLQMVTEVVIEPVPKSSVYTIIS